MNVCIVLPWGDDQTSVSVCVRGGASDRPCLDLSPPEVFFVNHTLFHSLLIHRYKNLHASGYINLYQSCLLLIFFWAQHILTFTEKIFVRLIDLLPSSSSTSPHCAVGLLTFAFVSQPLQKNLGVLNAFGINLKFLSVQQNLAAKHKPSEIIKYLSSIYLTFDYSSQHLMGFVWVRILFIL